MYLKTYLFKRQIFISVQFLKMKLQNQDGTNIRDNDYFKAFKEKQYSGHKKCPTAMAWNKSGSILVTAETLIKVWSFGEKEGLEKSHELKGHENNIESAQFCNNNLFATLSRDCFKFWDIRQGSKINQLKSEKKNKQDFIRFAWMNTDNPQNAKFAIINKENNVLVYDYRNTATPQYTLTTKSSNNSQQICAVAWDRSDSVLFVVGGQSSYGSISMYNTQNYELIADPMNTHCGRITDISFSRDNQKFATVSQDSLLEIHCIPQIICQRVFSNKDDSCFKRVSFNYDGKYVATSSDSSFIDIYNARDGGLGFRLKCTQVQQVLSWHPKRNILAYLDEEDKKKSLDRGDDSYVHLFHQ